MSNGSPAKRPTSVRCAIYSRKSTEEGLEQEFNSLDAQREAAENYIASMKHEGWLCLAERYDDGGFTGGNMERPALKRLLNDVNVGKIDCVVVYKVDRLSRSLLDFARIIEIFDRHKVSFVSVTQQFNTASSMGRLMLNVLLSFAQFEREIISERTRDKMAAARRKGKRLGGIPVLGYDVDPQTRRLVPHPEEAKRVGEIFTLYLECGGLVPTLRELGLRRWTTKCWKTRKDRFVGGRPFNKANLHYLLTNVTYLGQVKYEERTYAGEHEAIIEEEMFKRVQQVLRENRNLPRRQKADRVCGSLEGLLYCTSCNAPMAHTYSTKGPRRYRYYVCSPTATRSEPCATRSIPAADIEAVVWQELAADSRIRERFPAPDRFNTAEQSKRVQEAVDRVEYDGRDGDLRILLRSEAM